MSERLTRDAFAKNLNTKFRIYVNDAESIEAELTEVSQELRSAKQERFAIVFRGPNELFLGQGMRRFEHDQMQRFELFIVPIGQDKEGTYYEAVFNRLITES